jgi:hypothetical protein
MDNIVRSLEEIELTEAELEVIYGAGIDGDIDGFRVLGGIPSGTTRLNIDGTSFFTATCVDRFFVHTTITKEFI